MHTQFRFLLAAVLAAPLTLASGEAPAQVGPAAVCEAAEQHYAAIRASDNDAVLQQHLPEFTFFTNDGGLLWSFDSLDQQRTGFEEPAYSSTKTIRHCSAQLYGDVGIATYYLVGSETVGDSIKSGTWRVTEVWVRQGNQWKEAHHHESPLLGAVDP